MRTKEPPIGKGIRGGAQPPTTNNESRLGAWTSHARAEINKAGRHLGAKANDFGKYLGAMINKIKLSPSGMPQGLGGTGVKVPVSAGPSL
ncbi:MAG: hypothetical protein M1816_000283 [Peltula sp. TS41687]|nr:MAG: hypothetical protein M1816_000283 [Peltula sp. TS41687]